jgi:hypothetical protein
MVRRALVFVMLAAAGGTTFAQQNRIDVVSPLAAGQKPGGEYRVITRDPSIRATLHGDVGLYLKAEADKKACLDAQP